MRSIQGMVLVLLMSSISNANTIDMYDVQSEPDKVLVVFTNDRGVEYKLKVDRKTLSNPDAIMLWLDDKLGSK